MSGRSIHRSTGAVAIATQGVVHSRTIESVLEATRYRWPFFFSHDLPIPDAQNDVVGRAIAERCEWLLIVEADNTVPPDLLRRAHPDRYVQVLDYAIPGGSRSVHLNRDKSVLYAGLGCMLVHQSVFDRIHRPWFDCRAISVVDNPKTNQRELVGPGIPGGRGADPYFCWQLQEAGIRIHRMSGEAGHWRIREMREDAPHRIVKL